MKFVFAGIPGYGHLYPLMPLAMACAERGHEVTIATGAPMLDRLPLPTLDAWGDRYPTLAAVEAETARRYPDADGMEFGVAMFVGVTGAEYAQRLIEAFASDRPDLVITEPTCAGAVAAASVHGIPAAVLNIGGSWEPFGAALFSRVDSYLGPCWTDRQRPVPAVSDLARAFIDPVPPIWAGAASAPWPVLPIRTVGFSHAAVPVPQWLTAPSPRPRVYLTLGTVSFGAVEALRRAVLEAADAGCEVLVAVGPDGDPAALGELPDAVHLERFVAQEQVLPLVDLVIHHGGTGTTMGVLAAGKPQIMLPQGADQFLNAARLAEIGAGRVVPNDAPAGAITAAITDILRGGSERAVAGRVAAEIAEMPSPTDVVADLERLAAADPPGGQPSRVAEAASA